MSGFAAHLAAATPSVFGRKNSARGGAASFQAVREPSGYPRGPFSRFCPAGAFSCCARRE
jgi:hypothetical protein